MFWVPPAIVLLFFLARILELRHRFRATPGRISHRWTFSTLTAAGSLTVLAAVAEYLIVRPPPSLLLAGLGVALALAAFLLRDASRRALDRMWSVHIEIRQDHTLVQHGPYRYVRHPIYVGMLLEIAAAVVVLGSWRTGIAGLVISAVAIVLRVRAEEAAMARQLGTRWTEYCQKTGAFFPLW